MDIINKEIVTKVSKKISSDEKKEKIIRAAIKVFSKKNYMRTTTRAIAKEADIAEGTIYKYFTGKEALFVAIINFIGDAMIKRWEGIRKKKNDPFELLYAIGVTHFDKIIMNKSYSKVIFQAISEISIPEVKEALQTIYVKYLNFFSSVLCEAKKNNLMDPDIDPKIAAWNFVSIGFTMNLIGLLSFEEKQKENLSHLLGKFLFKAISNDFYNKKYENNNKEEEL